MRNKVINKAQHQGAPVVFLRASPCPQLYPSLTNRRKAEEGSLQSTWQLEGPPAKGRLGENLEGGHDSTPIVRQKGGACITMGPGLLTAWSSRLRNARPPPSHPQAIPLLSLSHQTWAASCISPDIHVVGRNGEPIVSREEANNSLP